MYVSNLPIQHIDAKNHYSWGTFQNDSRTIEPYMDFYAQKPISNLKSFW